MLRQLCPWTRLYETYYFTWRYHWTHTAPATDRSKRSHRCVFSGHSRPIPQIRDIKVLLVVDILLIVSTHLHQANHSNFQPGHLDWSTGRRGGLTWDKGRLCFIAFICTRSSFSCTMTSLASQFDRAYFTLTRSDEASEPKIEKSIAKPGTIDIAFLGTCCWFRWGNNPEDSHKIPSQPTIWLSREDTKPLRKQDIRRKLAVMPKTGAHQETLQSKPLEKRRNRSKSHS